MPNILDINDAEASFLEIMRENATDFEMTISRKAGHWILGLKVLSVDKEPGLGEGATFSEAWDNLAPWWAS